MCFFSCYGNPCGFGLFECVKRSSDPLFCVRAYELKDPYNLYNKLKDIEKVYRTPSDDVYNMHNFMAAVNYINANCTIENFGNVVKNYDTLIFEGGQGLLLDQKRSDDFPYLTPSSTGSEQISRDIKLLKVTPELYYVSRSYMTRHGAGPMDMECKKDEINPNIVDETNIENEFQGKLRFGKIDLLKQWNAIANDMNMYDDKVVNLVYTQLNYTGYFLETTDGKRADFSMPYADHIYISDQKDHMELLK